VQWLQQHDAHAQHPKFTALPRAGGFLNILTVVQRDFEGVLDITIRYESGGTLAPEIPSLFMGTDEAVYLDAEWIMTRDIPAPSDPAAVKTWLNRQFARKDALMIAAPSQYLPISSVRAFLPLHFHSPHSPAPSSLPSSAILGVRGCVPLQHSRARFLHVAIVLLRRWQLRCLAGHGRRTLLRNRLPRHSYSRQHFNCRAYCSCCTPGAEFLHHRRVNTSKRAALVYDL
jgi:hypothetical protein